MKNFTIVLILLFPFYSFLGAQCFDLTSFEIFACQGVVVNLDLDISGGEAPYNVEWTSDFGQGNGTVTEQNGSFELAVTEPSTYNFTVTDNTGCQESISSGVQFGDQIFADIDIFNGTCSGSCDGSAFIIASGGSGGYSFDWSNGFNGSQSSNLCAGNYSVTITDQIGCSDFITFTILDPTPLVIDFNVVDITPVSCEGSADGAIENILIFGGVPPFTFEWTGPNGFSSIDLNLTNLTGGTYSLAVTDANNCTTPGINIDVPESDELELEYTTSPLACMNDGFIQIDNVIGGNPPFSYSLNGLPFTEEDLFENLIAGVYNIDVLDALGCSTNIIVSIQSNITMELTPSFADCDSMGGTVVVNNLQGTTDASFVWSNGDIGPEANNLAPGGYSVTVTDNVTNCVTHQNVEVLYDPACFVQISGTILNDFENDDCVEDVDSEPAAFILVSLSNGDLTFTDENGYYEFETEPGTYEVSIDLSNTLFDPLCSPPITVDVSNFGGISNDNDFWVTYPITQDLAIWVYSGAIRPGFDQTISVHARNLGGFPMDGTVSFMHDPLQSFLNATPDANYDQATSTLSWDFEDLAPGEYTSFVVNLNLPADVEIGTPITYFATIGPEENDIDLTNNTKVVNRIVTGSFDPNDKQVTPRGEGDTGDITRADSLLTYQVRFQNTGTDTAFTVVVLDEISDELDINTVRPGASSHPYRLNIIDGKTLEFRFEDILLPDSFVNEPASNGFVLFDIKTKKDLPYGTTFENTAAIFFDFNEPIITNTTINTLANPVAVNDLEIRTIPTEISPNPGDDQSMFIYTLEQPTIINLNLYDLNGKLLHNFINQKQILSGTHQVSLVIRNYRKGFILFI